MEIETTAAVDTDAAAIKWIFVARIESRHTETITSVLFSKRRHWTTHSFGFSSCLELVRSLGSIDRFAAVPPPDSVLPLLLQADRWNRAVPRLGPV